MNLVKAAIWVMVLFALAPLASAQDGRAALLNLEAQVAQATEKVYPSLLYIQPVTEDFSGGRKEKRLSSGSGVIYTKDGLALTNYHVAGHAKYLTCTLSNKEKIEASLVGGDPWTDVAVIRLDPKKFHKLVGKDFVPAKLGKSSALRPGQHVLAMGSPFGYDRSVSLGIVSCTDRFLAGEISLPSGELTGGYNTWIQTDAAINPGNSGGPLVSLSGEVIGINARVLFFGNSIGFSIPIDVVAKAARSIEKNGKVVRSWLGVSLQPVAELEEKFERRFEGVLLSGVVSGSAADEAGVAAGEILTKVNGVTIRARHMSQIPGVREFLADLPVGREAVLTLASFNGGGTREVRITPVERSDYLGTDFECPEWGVTLKSLTSEMVRTLSVPVRKGVMVFGVQPGSPASLGEMTASDVIVQVEGRAVDSLKTFVKIYDEYASARKPELAITVYRGKSLHYVLITPSYGQK